MAHRLGIELVPSSCRIVVLDDRSGLFRRRSARVTAFHELPYHESSPGQLADDIRQLRIRGSATVAIWGLRGVHHVMTLPPADPIDLEAMARREAQSPGGPLSGSALRPADRADGVIPGETTADGRREVTFVSVPAAEVRARVEPLTDAGLEVSHVLTPALAHAALARQRWGALSNGTTAVLAVNARATALTIVRGATVLFAREMPWGHESDRGVSEGALAGTGSFAAQLASELRRSAVFVKQRHQADVTQVLICGDVPDLRALTGPLMHDLNVEVEILDSPDGLDLTQLPEPAEAFRSRLGALRTAWVLASGSASTVNLRPREGKTVQRRRITPKQQTHLWRAAAAGLLIAVLAWGAIEWLTRSTRDHAESLRRQIAILEPDVQRLEETRLARATNAARRAALEAFATQGPRLARVLEVLGRGAPPEVAITSLKVSPTVGAWDVTVEGQALAPTPTEAQAAFSRFAKAINGTDYLGEPVQAPEIKVHVEEPEPEPIQADAAAGAVPPTRRFDPALEDLQQRRQAAARPREQWVARDGKLYRLTLRPPQQSDTPVDDWRVRGAAPAGSTVSEPKKYVGAVLDFVLQYEVRK